MCCNCSSNSTVHFPCSCNWESTPSNRLGSHRSKNLYCCSLVHIRFHILSLVQKTTLLSFLWSSHGILWLLYKSQVCFCGHSRHPNWPLQPGTCECRTDWIEDRQSRPNTGHKQIDVFAWWHCWLSHDFHISCLLHLHPLSSSVSQFFLKKIPN